MKMRVALKLLPLLLLAAIPAAAQDTEPSVNIDLRPRILLGGEVGTETSLGYKFPSIGLGSGVEIPIARRFELQTKVLYSPDAKYITNNGTSLQVAASAIGFATQRLGFVGSVERSSLWTSEFNERSVSPAAGIVLRNDYFGPGRLFVTYVFPTGCVWATAGNPCPIQSKRLQGIEINQEVRGNSHVRWGFRGGAYRFCDQANPNEPQTGRNCHLGVAALATFRFELHLGSRSHFAGLKAVNADGF